MPNYLAFSIHFLQPRVHGRGDEGEPEWPPSPLRLIQSLVAASAAFWNERQHLDYAAPAIQWLESVPPPLIIAPTGILSEVRTQFYVPDNTTELLVPSWKKGETDKTPKRTEKVVRPTHLLGDTLHYLFSIPEGSCEHFDVLQAAARSITHLGWGIDMVAGDASIISSDDAAKLEGERWSPSPAGGVSLRVPMQGTLADLMRKHSDFLNRISADGFRPVPPLREFEVVQYRSQNTPLPRPSRVFELRNFDGSRFRYSHRKFIHIAGMVRHQAIEAMKKAGAPRGVSNDWIETYIAGHRKNELVEHRQLSYIPLPSIGHEHADPGIRRIMIVAPLGDNALLDYVARRLGGQQLQPDPKYLKDFACEPPLMVPLPRSGDTVTRRYTSESKVWHSFTPVILPGHDDHKPEKTRGLIEKALVQSGVEQPCKFEWSAFSQFSKSFSAHKYDKSKQPIGYIRPDHLMNQTAVHLRIEFDHPVPGPITIGAGRHCGFGLMAAISA